jgi:pimeloyl-ACP methyl ester carboxylesterase
MEEFDQRLSVVPDLRTHTVPDCGHMLHHDQPELLAREIEAFLR